MFINLDGLWLFKHNPKPDTRKEKIGTGRTTLKNKSCNISKDAAKYI